MDYRCYRKQMILTERLRQTIEELGRIQKSAFETQVEFETSLARRAERTQNPRQYFQLVRNQIPNPYDPMKQFLKWVAYDLGKAEALRRNPERYLCQQPAY